MMPVRALESGVFLAYANWAGTEADWHYAGLSVICGPDGSERARAGAGAEIVIADLDVADVAAARERLPYLRDVRFSLDRPF
jgi:5-aminopentanamidase